MYEEKKQDVCVAMVCISMCHLNIASDDCTYSVRVARPEGATAKVEIGEQMFASVINGYIRIWMNSKGEQSISLKDCILLHVSLMDSEWFSIHLTHFSEKHF